MEMEHRDALHTFMFHALFNPTRSDRGWLPSFEHAYSLTAWQGVEFALFIRGMLHVAGIPGISKHLSCPRSI